MPVAEVMNLGLRAAQQRLVALLFLPAAVEVVEFDARQHRHRPRPDLLGRAVVDPQPARPALHLDAAGPQGDLVAVEPLVGVPDEEQVVRAGRDDRPQQPPFLGVEVLGLVHQDGPVGQSRLLQFEQAPGIPDDAAPLGLAAPEQSLDVVLADLPDPLTLDPAQCPSPPDPGHLEVIGGGLDLVRLDDLLPLLPQEAEVELALARLPGSPPPSRCPARRDWRSRTSGPDRAGTARPRHAGGRPRSGRPRGRRGGRGSARRLWARFAV